MADRQGPYYDGSNPEMYLQSLGPNTEPIYEGCVDIPGYDQPLGDISVVYCRGEQILSSKGTPGRVPLTITVPFGPTSNALDEWIARGCRGQLFINWYCRGRKGVFAAYERGTLFKDLNANGRGMTNMLQSLPGGEGGALTQRTYAVTAANDLQDYFVPRVTRKTFAGTHPLIDIAFCSQDECGGVCGPPDFLGRSGFVTPSMAASAGEEADIWTTDDYGITWAQTATDPFGNGLSAGAAVCFPISATVKRMVTARATTEAGQHAEIAYSEDSGATWTNVDVGTVDGEFFPRSMSLFNLHGTQKIWGVTDTGAGTTGNIYYSEDGGLTWTLQLTGATDALNAVWFLDNDNGLAVGDTNELWSTSNGGTDWGTVAGPAAQAAVNALSCVVTTKWRWFVGYSDGTLWYTEDGGANWLQRALAKPAGWVSWNAINAMDAWDESCIWMAVHYTGAAAAPWGAMLRSVDGGFNWEPYNSTVACAAGGTGLQGIEALGYNHAFAVGCVAAGTGLILEASV